MLVSRHPRPWWRKNRRRNAPAGRGDVERTAAVVERIRQNLLMALRETYSIVILASLSLVIAAFPQNVAPDAVPTLSEPRRLSLAAVVLTILHEIRRTARRSSTPRSVLRRSSRLSRDSRCWAS